MAPELPQQRLGRVALGHLIGEQPDGPRADMFARMIFASRDEVRRYAQIEEHLEQLNKE